MKTKRDSLEAKNLSQRHCDCPGHATTDTAPYLRPRNPDRGRYSIVNLKIANLEYIAPTTRL